MAVEPTKSQLITMSYRGRALELPIRVTARVAPVHLLAS